MTRQELERAPSQAVPAATDGGAGDAAIAVTLRLGGTLDGLEASVEATMTPGRVRAFVKWAHSLGLEPRTAAAATPQAQGGAKPPEGMCAIHGAKMKRHEKDGKSWYSHKAEDDGGEYWCKGEGR